VGKQQEEQRFWPVGAPANDETFDEPPPDPPIPDAAGVIEAMLNAPTDLPVLYAARSGLQVAMVELVLRMPSASVLGATVSRAFKGLEGIADTETVSAEMAAGFIKRRGRHGHYLCLISLAVADARRNPGVRVQFAPVAALIGAWAVRLRLDGWTPPRHQYSRVVESLLRPDSTVARSWSLADRERYAADNLHWLQEALQANAEAAGRLGFRVGHQPKGERDPIADFNSRFRRRMHNLFDYKSTDDQAGAGGHGTLSNAAVKRSGRELLAGFRVADPMALHCGLEIVSHLTSEQVQCLPVQTPGSSLPPGAFAWLDLEAGEYCYVLLYFVEKGARPDFGTESLYERTVQVVRIGLTPPLAAGLRAAVRGRTEEIKTVSELLGRVAHGPYVAITGSGPYRMTAAKLQKSVPALLVQEGRYRWAVSLATSSRYLVCLGRLSYSIARSSTVHETVNAACALLGWPAPVRAAGPELIGAFTMPKIMSIVTVFALVREAADASSLEGATHGGVVECLVAHAAYLSMLLALCYALRDAVVYGVPASSLKAGRPAKFSDKDVHEVSMPGVPTLPIVMQAMNGWETLVKVAVAHLIEIGTAEARALASALKQRIEDLDTPGWIFMVNAAGHLEPVGTSTWRNSLLPTMRLVENFARQFWPFYLAELGVTQRDMDILMRHQMPSHHPGSVHNARAERDAHEALVKAMTAMIRDRLQLVLPKLLASTAEVRP
jgi:hypothetical protein